MKLLTRTADLMLNRFVPHADASATIKLYCGCINGRKWYKDCQDLNGELKCGGCNVKSSTKC